VRDRGSLNISGRDEIGSDEFSEPFGGISVNFFAGITGWSYALQLAGWPDDREVWTGSCPCQPLSSAGQRKGHADERHLWPAFYNLIAECRPATIFGEQVASKDGREWLAGVRADLEAIGYAVGAANLCAAGAGAPHIRQRLFWVADAAQQRQSSSERSGIGENSVGRTVGVIDREQPPRKRAGERRHDEPQRAASKRDGGATGGLGDAAEFGQRAAGRDYGVWAAERRSSFWTDAEWLPCLDGKARRAQPGIQPLAHGVSARVGKLRAAGNAIVPQVAAEFVTAFMECR
jgi:DNA (cytosine-5)-methyltransferase 1